MWGDEGTFLVSKDHEQSNCDFGYAIVAPNVNKTKFSFSKAIPLITDCKSFILHIMLLHRVFLKF